MNVRKRMGAVRGCLCPAQNVTIVARLCIVVALLLLLLLLFYGALYLCLCVVSFQHHEYGEFRSALELLEVCVRERWPTALANHPEHISGVNIFLVCCQSISLVLFMI